LFCCGPWCGAHRSKQLDYGEVPCREFDKETPSIAAESRIAHWETVTRLGGTLAGMVKLRLISPTALVGTRNGLATKGRGTRVPPKKGTGVKGAAAVKKAAIANGAA
jgi:hypothetical protein